MRPRSRPRMVWLRYVDLSGKLEPLSQRRSTWCTLAAIAAWLLVLPPRCWANDFDAFQRARSAYDAGNYERAAALFGKLVGSDVPRLQNRSLVLESLKYLGASYLFLGHESRAEAQFHRLLELDLDYVLDPLAFPEEVQAVFMRVKTRLSAQAEDAARAEALAREHAQTEQARERAEQKRRMDVLIKMASTEHVVVHHSRLTAMVPFGVGQFQNGHDTLGLTLAIVEGLLYATAATTYMLHDSLDGRTPENLDEARFAERAYRYGNQAAVGLLVLVAVAGIVDAQVRFQAVHSYDKERPLPPELLEQEPDISVSPTGVRLRF